MARARRYIKANKLYEIGFRARNCLPFVCTDYMALIIQGTLARVQRDSKVVLHHYIWEGSHAHLLCTAKDADSLQRFYAQLKKQLTDAIKRLTGREYLHLYDNRASVIELATIDDAISKVAYIYANPSNDDLVSTIEQYPGVSSWNAFQSAKGLDACVETEHDWIRLGMIPRLKTRSVSSKQDRAICDEMLSQLEEAPPSARLKHKLAIHPNKWIENFIESPSDSEVEEIVERCRIELRAREEENLRRRSSKGKRVLGKRNLRRQTLLGTHRPKDRLMRIFVQCRDKELRLELLREFKEVSARCRKAYEQWKRGECGFPWPPGTFRPPMPPTASRVFAY